MRNQTPVLVTVKGALHVSGERERTTGYGEVTFEKDLENWVVCHSVEGCGH